MFAQRKTVGHAGDVVRHGALPVGALGKAGAQFAGALAIGVEQLAHHLSALRRGVDHLRVAVQVGEQKALEHSGLFAHPRTELNQRRRAAGLVRAGHAGRGNGGAGGGHHVVHLLRQHAPDRLVQHAAAVQRGEVAAHRGHCARKERHRFQLRQREQARAHAVVDVVRVVGDFVRQVGQLRLQAGLRAL